jgi:hypothetical protein
MGPTLSLKERVLGVLQCRVRFFDRSFDLFSRPVTIDSRVMQQQYVDAVVCPAGSEVAVWIKPVVHWTRPSMSTNRQRIEDRRVALLERQERKLKR